MSSDGTSFPWRRWLCLDHVAGCDRRNRFSGVSRLWKRFDILGRSWLQTGLPELLQIDLIVKLVPQQLVIKVEKILCDSNWKSKTKIQLEWNKKINKNNWSFLIFLILSNTNFITVCKFCSPNISLQNLFYYKHCLLFEVLCSYKRWRTKIFFFFCCKENWVLQTRRKEHKRRLVIRE